MLHDVIRCGESGAQEEKKKGKKKKSVTHEYRL